MPARSGVELEKQSDVRQAKADVSPDTDEIPLVVLRNDVEVEFKLKPGSIGVYLKEEIK